MFELCYLLFSFVSAIVVDDYIGKHKVGGGGALPGALLDLSTLISCVTGSGQRVSLQEAEVSDELLLFVIPKKRSTLCFLISITYWVLKYIFLAIGYLE